MIHAFDKENSCAHTPIWVAHDSVCLGLAAAQKPGVFLILLCQASLSKNMEALMSIGVRKNIIMHEAFCNSGIVLPQVRV